MLIGYIQEVADTLQNGFCIGHVSGVLPQLYEFFEEVIYIGKVEVSGNSECPVDVLMRTNHRVATADSIASLCTISQMAQEYFACKREMLLENFCFIMGFGKVSLKSFVGLIDFFEYVGPGLGFVASQSLHVWAPGSDIQFYYCQTCTILAAVSLLFHKHVELIEAPHGSTIFFLVIFEGFSKPDKT